MSAEPPRTMGHSPGTHADRCASAAGEAAVFAARTLPVLHALDAVLAEDEAGLAEVLSLAEGQRSGATAALAAALVAEAGQLRRLAQRAEDAAERLYPRSTRTEPAADTGAGGNA